MNAFEIKTTRQSVEKVITKIEFREETGEIFLI